MANESLATDPALLPIWDRLERLEQNITRIGAIVNRVAEDGPGVVSTVVNTVDDMAARAFARGIDIDAVLHALVTLTSRLAMLMESPEFGRLVASGALTPESTAMAAHAGDALAETCAEPGGKAGILALVRAVRDPEVQRALDFGLRFMKRFGRALDSGTAALEPVAEDDHG